MHILVLGAGAAGVFAALSVKQHHPNACVEIWERGSTPLTKVKISGGGRCNVTHHLFDPKELVKNYPRGSRELLSPFYTFGPSDMIAWLAERGIETHTESDGRMFPVTNSSQTIIDCFLHELDTLGVRLKTQQRVTRCTPVEGTWQVNDQTFDALIMATGSHPSGHALCQSLGHTIVPPRPSLFSCKVSPHNLKELQGISFHGAVTIEKTTRTGPILITHQGFSGPTILKLSSLLAPRLYDLNYQTSLHINALPDTTLETLIDHKTRTPHKRLSNLSLLPKRLCQALIPEDPILSQTKHQDLEKILFRLQHATFSMHGKSTHTQEFVTCGGVDLKQVHFKTLESKLLPGLYFAGELLNIDAVTGGFNFQNAWTTGFIAGKLSGTPIHHP